MEPRLVKVDLGEGVTAEVEVHCYSNTSEHEMEGLALSKLKRVVNKRVSSLTGLGASLRIISEFGARHHK